VSTMSESEVREVIDKLINLMISMMRGGINPGAIRAGLIIALEIDTMAVLKDGSPPELLAGFDSRVKKAAKEWLKRIGV